MNFCYWQAFHVMCVKCPSLSPPQRFLGQSLPIIFRGRSKELSNFIIPISRGKLSARSGHLIISSLLLGKHQVFTIYFYSCATITQTHYKAFKIMFQIEIFITFTSGTKFLVLACWQFFCKRDANVCTT